MLDVRCSIFSRRITIAYQQEPPRVPCFTERPCRLQWPGAMWNFSGGFGIVDSDRADVKYEEWHGRKLDREMLKLLQEFNG